MYPVVFVAIEEERRDHKFAGQDSVDRTVSINVLTKVKSRSKSKKNITVDSTHKKHVSKFTKSNKTIEIYENRIIKLNNDNVLNL